MRRMSDEQNLSLIGELSPNSLGLAFKATYMTYLSSRQSNLDMMKNQCQQCRVLFK